MLLFITHYLLYNHLQFTIINFRNHSKALLTHPQMSQEHFALLTSQKIMLLKLPMEQAQDQKYYLLHMPLFSSQSTPSQSHLFDTL